MTTQDTMDDADRRRKVRKNALVLTVVALLIYVGFIIAYINRGG